MTHDDLGIDILTCERCCRCANCEALDELIAVGLVLADWEVTLLGGTDLELVYGPAPDGPDGGDDGPAPADSPEAPLPLCDNCRAPTSGEHVMGIPVCGDACRGVIEDELARDRDEMDHQAAVRTLASQVPVETPLAALLRASIEQERQKRLAQS